MSGRALLLTVVTLVAFASNSVLCRFALREGEIDAGSFTAVRLVSGAVFLWLVIVLPRRRPPSPNPLPPPAHDPSRQEEGAPNPRTPAATAVASDATGAALAATKTAPCIIK